ncbi:MAG: 50S ribosomal protein L6 [Candidatus Peribacteraceae bacterium]|nr:50S ribosomal protein L6 [Candidatus Peribacteraceae bacterium]
MSRIGARAIGIPQGVTVEVKDRTVRIKGSKGELSYTLPVGIGVDIDGAVLKVKRLAGHDDARALHGLARSILQNMAVGVSQGHERKLEIVGVGYKAMPKGKSLSLSLGFSHPVDFPLPDGIEVVQDEKNKNLLTFKGVDKQLVGQVSANLRSLRPPEPYKGKGIHYTDEIIRRKPGKAAAAKGAPAA